MTSQQVVLGRVGQVRGRIRLLLAQQWACVGLTWALVASLALVAATKLHWWTDAIDWIWALLIAGGIAGLLIAATRKITPMAAAQIADERGGLKERLSTAVEMSERKATEEVAHAQLLDAAAHAGNLRLSQLLPWRAPRQWRFLLAAAAILLAVIYVPELPIFHSKQDRLDREVMQREGTKIQAVAKALEKRAQEQKKEDEKNAEILRRIAENMKQLGKEQARGRITKKQALLKMNELQEQLKDNEEKIAGGKAEKSLEQVAAEMADSAKKQSRSGNKENAEELQRMAENLQKRDFDAAKKQLEELGKKLQEGKLTAAEAAAAAEMLQQMAQSMDKSGVQEAGKQLQDAAKDLAKASEMAKQLEKQLASAKSDAERQQIQQQMMESIQQASAQAGQQCSKAGGT